MLMWFPAVLVALVIRPTTRHDAEAINSLMAESVDKLGRLKYGTDQTEAWLAAIPNITKMISLLEEPDRVGWLAVSEKQRVAVGYIDWKRNTQYLDFLYVHPEHARKGVATRLFRRLMSEVGENVAEITTEASEGSKPFFERQGFKIIERQEFPIGADGVLIHNYKMILRL